MQAGDAGARDALFAAAYAELRRLARVRLREGARDVVLDTTCLVHESVSAVRECGRASGRGSARVLRLCLPSDAFGDRQRVLASASRRRAAAIGIP